MHKALTTQAQMASVSLQNPHGLGWIVHVYNHSMSTTTWEKATGESLDASRPASMVCVDVNNTKTLSQTKARTKT